MNDAKEYEFDVAVSFAGEDREFVGEIARQLSAVGVRVFYDQDLQVELWGEDLVEYFDAIYRLKSRFAILFVSRRYAEKMWTRHERRSALARALDESEPYVLPVRLDNTDLDGLRPTVGYLDARQVGVAGVVSAVQAKLGRQRISGPPVLRVPRTEIERQQMLLDRPPGWEYAYFAAQLLHERAKYESKFRDHEMGYAARTGRSLTAVDVWDDLSESAREAAALVGSLMRLMDPAVQERAFGAPGEPGDPDRLLHLAQRWNAIYCAWMDWAAQLRGTQVPSQAEHAVSLLAQFMNMPVRNYRDFVDGLVTDLDEALPAVARGEQVELSRTLVVEIADGLEKQLDEEFDKIRRTFG